MTDADIYKEVAEAAVKTLESYEVTACGVKIQWVRIYHIFRVWNLKNEFVSEHAELATAVTLALAKLQAERDAKDAPKLREERDKFKAALEQIREAGGFGNWATTIADNVLKGA